MKRLYTIKYTALACLMAFGISTALKAADAPESESVTKMLADAKRQAFGISLDAATLDSYMRQPKLSWTTHASEIDRMKNDINEEAKTVGKLNDARLGAAPWQTAAIDRIIPLMKEIATNTTNAIEFLNKNQAKPLTTGDYKDYIEANADTCKELASLIADFVDYGNNKNRAESLRQKLELPAK
jgi:hypothetical protein